jgi:hypothetical protein
MTDDDLQKILEALTLQSENVKRLADIVERLLRMHERTPASNTDIATQARWQDKDFIRVSAFAARRAKEIEQPVYVVLHGQCFMQVTADQMQRLGIQWDDTLVLLRFLVGVTPKIAI